MLMKQKVTKKVDKIVFQPLVYFLSTTAVFILISSQPCIAVRLTNATTDYRLPHSTRKPTYTFISISSDTITISHHLYNSCQLQSKAVLNVLNPIEQDAVQL